MVRLIGPPCFFESLFSDCIHFPVWAFPPRSPGFAERDKYSRELQRGNWGSGSGFLIDVDSENGREEILFDVLPVIEGIAAASFVTD